MTKGLESGKKKVCTATNRRECRQTLDRLADRPLRNLELERAVLRADERITLVTKLMKTPIIDPHVLRKLELANETGAMNGLYLWSLQAPVMI